MMDNAERMLRSGERLAALYRQLVAVTPSASARIGLMRRHWRNIYPAAAVAAIQAEIANAAGTCPELMEIGVLLRPVNRRPPSLPTQQPFA